ALRVAHEASPAARAIGAANTLRFRDGRIEADNTDAGGLLDAIDRPVAGLRALVLGAGGAGRAAAWALREAGAEVTLWNRTAQGAGVVDGLEVLVRQGARSFALWTGVEAPIEPMRDVARAV